MRFFACRHQTGPSAPILHSPYHWTVDDVLAQDFSTLKLIDFGRCIDLAFVPGPEGLHALFPRRQKPKDEGQQTLLKLSTFAKNG